MLHGTCDYLSQIQETGGMVQDGEGERCGRHEGLLHLESAIGEYERENFYRKTLELPTRPAPRLWLLSASFCSVGKLRGKSTGGLSSVYCRKLWH